MTLRGALVGYGYIGGLGHFPAYLERARHGGDVELCAVADICPERLAKAKQAWPSLRTYATYQELLAAEADKLDFIDIATPPCDHAEIAIAALSRGLHVLCEKPMAVSVKEAQRMIDAARAHQRVLYPVHNYKHAPVIKAVRELIPTIGQPTLVTLQTFRHTHAKGVSEWRTDWRREKAYSGGGIAMDHGSHSFYLAFEWMGGWPTAVTAKMATIGAFDTEDNFNATLTFPRGMATASLTWTAGIRRVQYSLHGTHGAILVADDELTLSRRASDGKLSVPEVRSIASTWGDASHVTWFNSLFSEFAAAIDRREFVSADTNDAFVALRTIEAAYVSAAENSREIKL